MRSRATPARDRAPPFDEGRVSVERLPRNDAGKVPDVVSVPAWRERAAIGLCAATTLIYEVAITRILSVVLWYHFVFLAVSLAMLGLGAPGVWFALRRPGPRALERALLAAAILVPLSIVALFRFGEAPGVRPVLATVCVALPMLALGTSICLLL